MAVVFYDGTGQAIVVTVVVDSLMDQYAGFSIFDFEDEQNPGLFDDIARNISQYTVVAGALQKDGTPVVVAGQGDENYQFYQFRQEYITAKNFLETAMSDWAGFSDAQKQQWVLDHMDEMMKVALRSIEALKYFYKRV